MASTIAVKTAYLTFIQQTAADSMHIILVVHRVLYTGIWKEGASKATAYRRIQNIAATFIFLMLGHP